MLSAILPVRSIQSSLEINTFSMTSVSCTYPNFRGFGGVRGEGVFFQMAEDAGRSC